MLVTVNKKLFLVFKSDSVFKGIVQPNIKILSSFIYPHVITEDILRNVSVV